MSKYKVYLQAIAGYTYMVEANNPEDALDKAWEIANLNEFEAYELDDSYDEVELVDE